MATSPTVRSKKERFLEAYAEIGTITHAARAAGVDRHSHQYWLKTDPEYVEAFRAAETAVADMLEKEAIRRASEGVTRAVYHKGEIVGYEQHYSDTLLIFLLKGHKPDKFKDRHQVTAEVTHRDDSDFDRAVGDLLAEFDRRSQSGSSVAPDTATPPDRT